MKVEKNFFIPQQFDIPMKDGLKTVWGTLLLLEGFPNDVFVVHYDDLLDKWIVSEFYTGMIVVKSAENKSETILRATAKLFLNIKEWEEVKGGGKEILKAANIPYPVNEIV